jgi:hypothetical protein
MAVAIANQVENHRGMYFEVTGDGATTTFTCTHNRFKRPNHTMVVKGVTAPTVLDRKQGSGTLLGTAVTISSSSCTNGVLSVTTSPAIANGTKAHFMATFDQPAD